MPDSVPSVIGCSATQLDGAQRLGLPAQLEHAAAAPKRKWRAACAVRSETSTCPGSAACSSRAAALTASPVASASPGRGSVTAITAPVLMPIRSSSVTP